MIERFAPDRADHRRAADEMETKADPDIMRDFAAPLPFIVISELLGIPKEDRAKFQVWTNAMVDTSESGQDATNQALKEFKQYMKTLIEEKENIRVKT